MDSSEKTNLFVSPSSSPPHHTHTPTELNGFFKNQPLHLALPLFRFIFRFAMLLRVAVLTADEAAVETTGCAEKKTYLQGNRKKRLENELFLSSFCIFLNCQHKNPALLEGYMLQAVTEAIVNKPFHISIFLYKRFVTTLLLILVSEYSR